SDGGGPLDAAAPDLAPAIYQDFPSAPLVDNGLPPGIAGQFATAGQGAGPCLVEPALGAMYPLNWTPPLFEWRAPSGENVFELRLHVENQQNDLLVYTAQSSYTMAAATWRALAMHS